MLKKKTNYDVETKASCLEDTATAEAGAVAYRTFRGEDVEFSNDWQIPFHAICSVSVTTTTEQIRVDDPTCVKNVHGLPHIDGADNKSINQGSDFDPMNGVKAYNGDDEEIPFTVSPSEIDTCEVGSHTLTYKAKGVTKTRTITVTQSANPRIIGIGDPIEAMVNEDFDALEDVTGIDGNGNAVTVTVEQPTPPEPPEPPVPPEPEYTILIDVSNYTAPNNTPVPTESPFAWDGVGYICDVEGLLVDGVPANVTRTYTMNDTDLIVVLDNGIEIYFHDYHSRGDSFTTRLYGQSNEVTFEHLIIKYENFEE